MDTKQSLILLLKGVTCTCTVRSNYKSHGSCEIILVVPYPLIPPGRDLKVDGRIPRCINKYFPNRQKLSPQNRSASFLFRLLRVGRPAANVQVPVAWTRARVPNHHCFFLFCLPCTASRSDLKQREHHWLRAGPCLFWYIVWTGWLTMTGYMFDFLWCLGFHWRFLQLTILVTSRSPTPSQSSRSSCSGL